MLCAHTVRRLKPGAFEEFQEKFGPPGDAPPAGWVRFHMLRDGDQVVTFGFFDGTIEELEASQDDHDFEERRASIESLVDEVIVNGVYEVVESLVVDGAS